MSGADRAIRVSTAAAVLGVAGTAAYVSYQHAFEVVRAHGESGLTARLEPGTIDGLVYSSSMVILYAARHRLPVPALARWLLALGIVATLAANVAHGWPDGPVGAVVAAWPAASLVGSYELVLWLIRTSAAGARTGDVVPGRAGAPADHPVTGLRSLQALAAARPQVPARQALLRSPPMSPVPAARMGPARTDRTGPRTGKRPAGPQRRVSAQPARARMKSTPRRWPPTGPALMMAARCRNAGSPRCTARPPAAGPATASQRPAAFLPPPWQSRRLGR